MSKPLTLEPGSAGYPVAEFPLQSAVDPDAAPAVKRHGSRVQPHLDDISLADHRSQAIRDLDELTKKWNLKHFEELVDQGRRAVWGGGSWDSPLLRATDTIGVPFMELWRHDSKHAEHVAENHFQVPAEFCSMIKAMIGRLHLKKYDKIRRILYFGSTCEPINMVLEHSRHDGYELHCYEAATAFKVGERREEMVRFFVNELRKTAVWLQGKPVDEDRLAGEIRLKNQVLRKVRRIMDLRLKRPYDLGSIPTLRINMGANHLFGNPVKFNEILDRLIIELEEAAKTPETRPYLPLVLAGGAPGGVSFFELLEKSNAVIVGLVIQGTSTYREDVPPLESLAHYLFDAQLRGELGEGAGASATLRRRRVEEIVKHTGARGLISSAITACPYASVVQQLERNYFRKQGFPIVGLEHTVHTEPATEEQTMKVRAFLEQLAEAC
ncbi:2-hydroxyglutaryl-CoA dehydratase [Opitutaceae bacterium TAV5]|nr:2-hydroxyglutaryl-CoA dehydratase [Opitutaceae bacterium TAV5]